MCALVTGVQTCALPISRLVNVIERPPLSDKTSNKVAESTPRASPNEKASQATSRFPIAMVLLTILTTLAVPTSPVCRIVVPKASRRGRACSITARSEEHTSELQSLMRISYADFCLKKKKQQNNK